MKIEKCKKSEENLLLTYINKYWKKNHVLVRKNDLMKWQHLDQDFYNFYTFKNNNNDICGLIGFIPTSKFDSKLINNKDYFGAIWSVNEHAPPAAGHFLIKKLISLESPKFIGFVGISNQAKVFYSRWGLEINYLNQFYIINNSFKSYKILKKQVVKNSFLNSCNSNFKLIKINNLSKLKLAHKYKPEKTIDYLIHRYQKHPVYKYFFYGLKNKTDNIICIFVLRKQIHLDRSCLRIIDIYGNINNIGSIKKHFEKLLFLENSEYIDVLNYGISEKIFQKLGFSKLDFSSDDIIIPNFFHPFVQENIKVEFSAISKYDDFVIFRGDGDQDRPS
jgi:hypothetical protein